MSAARAGAEAEGTQGTERGLLAHCHLSRAATTAAWPLRSRPPPTPARSFRAPPPRAVPPPFRRPSHAASHRASIIYVTSTPSPPPPSPLPLLPGLGWCARSSLLLLRSRGSSDVHKSRDIWQARPPRATLGSVPLPRERLATLAAQGSHCAKAGLHPQSPLPQRASCENVKASGTAPWESLRYLTPVVGSAVERCCEELEFGALLSRKDRAHFGLLFFTLHPLCWVLVFWLVRELEKQNVFLYSFFFFRKRQRVDL